MSNESRRTALVFGINYAPEPIGTALNNTWLTHVLRDAGWDVTMVTALPHYPEWRKRPAPRSDVLDGVRVLRRSHYVPARQSLTKRALYELSWPVAALSTFPAWQRPDVVVGVVPAIGGAPLAAVAAARFRIPYALLFQDLYGRAAEQSGFDGGRPVAQLLRRVELSFARRAARVGVVAEGFREYFTSAGIEPARVLRLRNPARCGEVTERRDVVRARLRWKPDEFVVLHSGTMGFKQGLHTVVEAAARAPQGVRFVLQGHGNQRASLEAAVRDRGLANVDFLPVASATAFPNVLAAADALLLCQRGTVVNMSMPAKLASYFLASRPVIAAVRGDDETATEVRESGGGLVVEPDSATALLDAVAALRGDPGRTATLGESGERFARESLGESACAEGVLRFVEAAAAGRRPQAHAPAPEGIRA